jgi:hypothetical protein
MIFSGNNHIFNEIAYNASRRWWTEGTVTAKQLERRASNPNYTLSASTEEFSLGEVSAPIIVFGDMTAGTVDRTLMQYLFWYVT